MEVQSRDFLLKEIQSDKGNMCPSLATRYRLLNFHVTESDGVLWIGFRPGVVHAIVKEVWNGLPLTRSDAERYYTELALLGKRRCLSGKSCNSGARRIPAGSVVF